MKVTAIHLGKKLAIREIQSKLGLMPSLKDPLVFEYSADKFVVTLKYGVCVFWGFNQGEINEFITKVSPFVSDQFEQYIEEEITVEAKGKDEIKSDCIYLESLNISKVALISVVLGRSVALDFYDKEVEKVLSEFESIMKSFIETGGTNQSSKNLVKKIGFAMNVRHLTVTQMAFLDKPDLTWDDQKLDKFYNELAEYYELDDRYEVLDDKLETIFRNAEFISDYITSRRTLAAEIIIIVLIAVELGIFFIEKALEFMK
jgi:uncharacterized Rmd1/YagE family protein